MLSVDVLMDLYRHMEWADSASWTAVLASDTAATDKKVLEYFYHLHMVQFSFLRVWRGEPRENPFPTFDNAAGLSGWGRTFYSDAVAHVAKWSDGSLREAMPVPWASMVERRIGREAETTSLGETALQVALHSQYHRGQINARLKELGGNPPLVDYIVWVWVGKPNAAWP